MEIQKLKRKRSKYYNNEKLEDFERLMNRDKYRYTLLVDGGAYFSDTVIGLLWEMFKHRLEHLRRDNIWMD